MALHLDERPDGGFALYIDGDFQFDSVDEAIYHETLALPALGLARSKKPEALRVLICGGGDGLALRECLRFPGVERVDLVDYDPTIVELARTRFAEINQRAFEDPRVHVHFQDAWEFLDSLNEPLYDVILCDFTVPRTPDQARIFTREWYAHLRDVLQPDGILAMNAVSPQTTPEAFWCLHRTVRSAGLSALPFHVCIPSFRAHGYGAWGFLLAAKRPLTARDLRTLDCPVATRLSDLTQLWRAARFRRSDRQMERRVPVQSLENNCLVSLLLNPGGMSERRGGDPVGETPYSLEPLLSAIPISHPYHTRIMIETLAEQVVSTVTQIDLRRLVEALLRRAARLPDAIRTELLHLRDYLSETVLQWDRLLAWGARLFAALVILMTLANAIAPDNAFAKGSAGLGHAGVSRGFSGSFGGSRSFVNSGRGRGGGSFTTSGSGGRGSFGRSGAFGSHSVFEHTSAPAIHGRGFRTNYGSGRPIDLYGDEYNIAPFRYYYGGTRSYFGPRQSFPAPGPQQEHKALFAADDDLLVMDNGDIVVTLSDQAYLLIAEGTVILRSRQSPESLLSLYPDPAFFETVLAQLHDRQAGVQQAIGVRRDWLSWVGWTSVLLPSVAQDKTELIHLQDLDRRLEAAIQRMGLPPAGAAPVSPPRPGQVDLFVDARLDENGQITIRQADGKWLIVDGRTISPVGVSASPSASLPCPASLASALKSVVAKLNKEMTGDIASLNHDLEQLVADRASLEKDLAEYTSLQASHDPSYEVDYGSDEIPVSDALSRTQRDIDQDNKDMQQTQAERDKLIADQKRLATAAPAFRP